MKKEELLDKYIKYNSKITFDIFKLIYQKLIDLGFTSPHTVEYAFKEFSGNYPYFVMKLYHDMPYFNQYNGNLIDQSEISVEDLLGYNPFESFKLPEKWCIEVQEIENTPEEIVNWRVNTVMRGTWVSPGYLNNTGYHTPEIDQEYTEITFEQFKQYVLNEPIMTKFSKPFPTQWCIKLTKENISIVGVYYNKKHLSEPNCDTYTENEAIGYYVKSHNDRNEYVKNGYTACSFFSEPSDSYPEITLEQFKEFVMNEHVKIETSKTEKDWCKATKEELIEEAKRRYPVGTKFISAMNPDYTYEVTFSEFYDWGDRGTDIVVNSSNGPSVYCGGKWAEIVSLPKSKVESTIEYAECIAYLCGLKVGQIYEVRDKRIGDYYYPAIGQFKPSTKEAFEAQNKPKSIEKWSPGTYVVCIREYGTHFKVGDIAQIEDGVYEIDGECVDISKSIKNPCMPFKDWCKWFATKSEAEAFAKTLVESVKEKTKQPLKQAVHCKTQEEWDFVTEKLGYKWTLPRFDETSWISLNANEYSSESYWKKNGYQILSFQEWCDLNEYKMKKTRFQAGDYVVSLRPKCLSTYGIKSNYCYIQYKDADKIYTKNATMYEDKPHYARLATPEEIEEYKRIGQPYDVTTLQSKTINTYGLNVGDTLDQDIICKWSGNAKNRYSLGEKAQWIQFTGFFCGDRVIKSFKVIDNVVGFLVSGTHDVYLRADGFKQFAEDYNKSKSSSSLETGKWYLIKRDFENYIGKFKKEFDDFFEFYYVNKLGSEEFVNRTIMEPKILKPQKYYPVYQELCIEEIQQYLPDGHPDKLNKESTTLEEITSNLISISNEEHEYIFKHVTELTIKVHYELETILSITEVELPLVNIIKTNSIKQLLNNN